MKDIEPYREVRPWGNFLQFTHNAPSTVKILTVEPGQALSLQFHTKRSEFWHVISGAGSVQIGEATFEAVPGKNFTVSQGTQHAVQAAPDQTLILLEIALGDFDEHDITRISDRYGRT